jgi:hypothetical protein
VRQLDPGARDESDLPGSLEGDLAGLFRAAGLRDVEEADLAVRVEHASFDVWWAPFTFGVGPAGAYVAGLDPARCEELKERCRQNAPPAPFTIDAHAWAARGRAERR